MNWQDELRWLLDWVPGGAERLVRAFDEDRIDESNWGSPSECGTMACAYGHIYGDREKASESAAAMRANLYPHNGEPPLTPLELVICNTRWHGMIRAEVVCWLAEHGQAVEPLAQQESVIR